MKRAAGIALAGSALTLAAFVFDAAPLFVPGVAFMLLGTLAPAWVLLSAQGAAVERHVSADRVMEGEPLEATLAVRRSWLGLPGARVLDPLSAVPVPLGDALSVIRGSRLAQVRLVTRFARRGLRHLEQPRLIIGDALGLAATTRRAASRPHDVLVLPRTEPVRWSRNEPLGQRKRSAGRAQAEPFAAVDVYGLRPYRLGTPASRIHWSALARGAGLLERRLQADGEMRALVVLDARGSGPPEHLDAAVRAAASLVLELARVRGCGLLLPGERRAIAVERDLAAWPAVHARLALVEGGPFVRAPSVGAATRRGLLVYVAAQPLERLPAGLEGSGERILVLPKDCASPPGLAASFEVAGCLGFATGAQRMHTPERAA